MQYKCIYISEKEIHIYISEKEIHRNGLTSNLKLYIQHDA
jgi:hypothetical protein